MLASTKYEKSSLSYGPYWYGVWSKIEDERLREEVLKSSGSINWQVVSLHHGRRGPDQCFRRWQSQLKYMQNALLKEEIDQIKAALKGRNYMDYKEWLQIGRSITRHPVWTLRKLWKKYCRTNPEIGTTRFYFTKKESCEEEEDKKEEIIQQDESSCSSSTFSNETIPVTPNDDEWFSPSSYYYEDTFIDEFESSLFEDDNNNNDTIEWYALGQNFVPTDEVSEWPLINIETNENIQD
jgi:hypothetical protein